MTSPLELRNAFEEPRLPQIAQQKGRAYARQLAHLASQESLFDPEDIKDFSLSLQASLRKRNPSKLVIDEGVFTDFRHQVADEASGLDEETLATADSTEMDDMIYNELRPGILGYDSLNFATSSMVVTEREAARVFERDYTGHCVLPAGRP